MGPRRKRRHLDRQRRRAVELDLREVVEEMLPPDSCTRRADPASPATHTPAYRTDRAARRSAAPSTRAREKDQNVVRVKPEVVKRRPLVTPIGHTAAGHPSRVARTSSFHKLSGCASATNSMRVGCPVSFLERLLDHAAFARDVVAALPRRVRLLGDQRPQLARPLRGARRSARRRSRRTGTAPSTVTVSSANPPPSSRR